MFDNKSSKDGKLTNYCVEECHGSFRQIAGIFLFLFTGSYCGMKENEFWIEAEFEWKPRTRDPDEM